MIGTSIPGFSPIDIIDKPLNESKEDLLTYSEPSPSRSGSGISKQLYISNLKHSNEGT